MLFGGLLLSALFLGALLPSVAGAQARPTFIVHLSPDLDPEIRNRLESEVLALDGTLQEVDVRITDQTTDADVWNLDMVPSVHNGRLLRGKALPRYTRTGQIQSSCRYCAHRDDALMSLFYDLVGKTLLHPERGLYPRLAIRDCRVRVEGVFILPEARAGHADLRAIEPPLVVKTLHLAVGVESGGFIDLLSERLEFEDESLEDGELFYQFLRRSRIPKLMKRCVDHEELDLVLFAHLDAPALNEDSGTGRFQHPAGAGAKR